MTKKQIDLAKIQEMHQKIEELKKAPVGSKEHQLFLELEEKKDRLINLLLKRT